MTDKQIPARTPPADSESNPGSSPSPVRQKSQAVDLLRDIANIANEAESVESALTRALSSLGTRLGWPVGHVYVKDRGEDSFTSSRLWYMAEGVSIDGYKRLAENLRIRPGEGFLGEVVESGESRWSNDLLDIFPRALAEALLSSGLVSIISFPLLEGAEVAGILEFFTSDSRPPHPKLLEWVHDFGNQLGRIMERRSLVRQLAERSTEERRRIAQELHDTIGQQLSGISMLVEALGRCVAKQRVPSLEAVRTIAEAVEQAKEDVRRLSRGLDPIEIGANALPDAIEELIENLTPVYQVECKLDCPPGLVLPDERTATILYFIMREMLHNAVQHSESERVYVKIIEDPQSHSVEVSVQDFGTGLIGSSEGTGFKIMRHRADLIGALIETDSTPGQGTTVSCRVPL